MLIRYACGPVIRDADRWAAQLFGCSGVRNRRLMRLTGLRLAESMTAESLLRGILYEVKPGETFRLEEDAMGKPFLIDSSLSVSLSHSGGYAVAALSDTPIGVDLQERRAISAKVLERCFSAEERAWIAAGDRCGRSTRLWTMKEAYVKLLGSGFFGEHRFFASFSGDTLQWDYGVLRFYFPEAPEGLLMSICHNAQP